MNLRVRGAFIACHSVVLAARTHTPHPPERPLSKPWWPLHGSQDGWQSADRGGTAAPLEALALATPEQRLTTTHAVAAQPDLLIPGTAETPAKVH